MSDDFDYAVHEKKTLIQPEIILRTEAKLFPVIADGRSP
jgi:hypothetical protein